MTVNKCQFYADTDLDEEAAARLCDALYGLAEGDTPLAFELLFTDEDGIRALNREMRKIDAVTDVLSFPTMDGIKGKPLRKKEHADSLDEEGRLVIGSVVICTARARAQAEEYGHSYERELFYLAVHGVLHCLGYDHETDEQRAEMREQEESVMIKLGLTREI